MIVNSGYFAWGTGVYLALYSDVYPTVGNTSWGPAVRSRDSARATVSVVRQHAR